ncbi:MAG: hypothetical protein Q8J97_07100, partial [Flavobacteriaceae bacterium]|nr:hypothetical protein [Flavobacteriaceae bacterium]
RPFVDNDHVYDGTAAAAASVMRSDFPNMTLVEMLNEMAATSRAKFADPKNRGRSARFVIDQLELQPPDNLQELVHAAEDVGAPLSFGRMKPDIVRVRVAPVEPNEIGVDLEFRITIADIKSSASMKRSHRMQVALYAIVIESEIARARKLRLLDQRAAFQLDTKGEVWLPSSFQRFLDLTRRRGSPSSASSPVLPLRECDDICVENFALEAAKHDVREYFRRFMPLVQRPDIEDVPWLLQPRRCNGCAFRDGCASRALEMRHAAMCMGTAELSAAQFVEGDANDSDADDSDLARETVRPLVDILADVPLDAPRAAGRRSALSMNLSEARSAAEKQHLSLLSFAIRKKIEAIDSGKPVLLDFVSEFNGFVPQLPGIVMVDATSPEAFAPSTVASVVLTTEPGIPSA